MAVDIALWIEGIKTIGTVLPNVLEQVNNSLGKIFVTKNDFRNIKLEIEPLVNKIKFLNKIGATLDEYIDYYIGSRMIFTFADKLIEMINLYKSKLSNENDVFYDTSWIAVEVAFKDITETKSHYINVILGRLEFFDQRDAHQIGIYVDNFNKFYIEAQTYLNERNEKKFKKAISDMSDQSQHLYKIFENSIKNMTNGLRNA